MDRKKITTACLGISIGEFESLADSKYGIRNELILSIIKSVLPSKYITKKPPMDNNIMVTNEIKLLFLFPNKVMVVR